MKALSKTMIMTTMLAFGFVGRIPAQTMATFSSEPLKISARALGFAGAMNGDNPDVSVLYGNPAALAFLENSSVLLTHTLQKSTDIMDENLTFPLFLSNNEALGVGLSVNHVGYSNQSSFNDFQVIQYGYDMGYGHRIAPDLGIGGTFRVRYAHTIPTDLWGVSGLIGMYYYPTPEVSYGIVVSGIGSGIQFVSDGEKTDLQPFQLPRRLTVGATMRFPSRFIDRQIFFMTLNAEKVFNQLGVRYYGGLEVIPFRFIAFRLGYFAETEDVEYAAYGIGLRMGAWKLDFGTTPSKLSTEIYQVSLTTSLWDHIQGN